MRWGSDGGDHEARLARLFRALLWLDLAWCAASLVLPGLPGWKMFSHGASPRFSVTDASGRAVDVGAWLPAHATLQDARAVVEVARFGCARRLAAAPLVVVFGARRVVVEEGCVARW